jgi:hypothetical protein
LGGRFDSRLALGSRRSFRRTGVPIPVDVARSGRAEKSAREVGDRNTRFPWAGVRALTSMEERCPRSAHRPPMAYLSPAVEL